MFNSAEKTSLDPNQNDILPAYYLFLKSLL